MHSIIRQQERIVYATPDFDSIIINIIQKETIVDTTSVFNTMAFAINQQLTATHNLILIFFLQLNQNQ